MGGFIDEGPAVGMLVAYEDTRFRILDVLSMAPGVGRARVMMLGPGNSYGSYGKIRELWLYDHMEVIERADISRRLGVEVEPKPGMRICYPGVGEYTVINYDEANYRMWARHENGSEGQLWRTTDMFEIRVGVRLALDFTCMELCADCGAYEYSNRLWLTADGTRVCQACYDEKYEICAFCEQAFRVEDMIAVAGDLLCCDDCHSERFVVCERCGDEILSADAWHSRRTDEILCLACSEREEEEAEDEGEGYFHDHWAKLPVVFHGFDSDMYYGMELEMECGRANRDKVVDAIADRTERDWYLENDGSLDNGIEVVAHARTFKSWQEFWPTYDEKALKPALRLGCTAHDNGNCGIHIHTSLAAWGEEQLYRLFRLLYDPRNYQDVLDISQRNERALSEWASLRVEDIGKSKETIQRKMSPFPGRYAALNITDHTLEIRIFRSNLRIERVRKNMEFVHALYCYTGSVKNVATWEGLMRWIERNKKDAKHLRQFMLDKGILSLAERSAAKRRGEPVEALPL
jgi:hypothetical protein